MELRIDIEPGSEPIRGVVRTSEQADGRAFCGWIELAGLIAAVHEGEHREEQQPDR